MNKQVLLASQSPFAQQHDHDCRSCGEPLFSTFVDLGMSPLANSYLKPFQATRMERFYPLHAYVCDACLLVQVPQFETPEHIFNDYAYFSSYSEAMVTHAREYTDGVVDRLSLDENSQVVEIASNDGYLLQFFVARGIPALGIEPAENVARIAIEKGITTLVQFFGTRTARSLVKQGHAADLVIANNVLAHVPDLHDFVEGIRILLAPAGTATIEFPHLVRLIEDKFFDTIYHEHFSYFSFLTVTKIFATHGLRIFDVEEIETHGGSLRIHACHAESASQPSTQRVAALEARERAAGFDSLQRYLAFSPEVRELKYRFLEFLIRAKLEGHSVVAYGAAAKGNTFLNYCGIGSDFIDYVVDRSPHKQGCVLPGTHIPVCHPDRILETKPQYLLIIPWNLKDEIVEQMAFIRSWGGRFVTAFPDLQIF